VPPANRVREAIQDRTERLMGLAENALLALMDAVQAATARGVRPEALGDARAFHRKAQWRLDFVAAENSKGFHAPQEAARILGEAIAPGRPKPRSRRLGAPRTLPILGTGALRHGAPHAPRHQGAGRAPGPRPAAAGALDVTASAVREQLDRVARRPRCRLTHYGRKTGHPHQVTVWFLVDGAIVYLVTAHRRRQWVRNVLARPAVELRMGGETFRGEVESVTRRGDRARDRAAEAKVLARPALPVAEGRARWRVPGSRGRLTGGRDVTTRLADPPPGRVARDRLMAEPERVIQLLLAIETETAGFYEGLARRAGEPPELRALWMSLAEDERQHAAWVGRLQGSRLAEGVLASLPAPPAPPLEAALDEIRRQRERIEHGGGSSEDALAVAIAFETSEASRALADLVASVPSVSGPDAFRPAPTAHLGELALAAERMGHPKLAARVRALAPRMEPAPAGRRTVLVVDDDADMLETCARILRQGGYECLTAAGGREALDVLRSRRLDAILADLRMPDMDGLTLLANARRLAPGVPTVIVTAYASMDSARRAREAGAAAYLAKPFGVIELRDVVARVLSGPPTHEGFSGPAADLGPMGSS